MISSCKERIMNKKPVKVLVCSDEEESWNTYWREYWFTRSLWESQYWKEEKNALKPLFSLLSRFKARSMLDSSCGLGFKTVLIAKEGCEVEGSGW